MMTPTEPADQGKPSKYAVDQDKVDANRKYMDKLRAGIDMTTSDPDGTRSDLESPITGVGAEQGEALNERNNYESSK